MVIRRAPKAKKPKTPEDPAVTAWYEEFRNRLVRLRTRKDYRLSQAALARLLDIPLDSYKQMEGGRLTRFPLHKLERLSDALRVSIEIIVTGKQARIAHEEDDTPRSRRAA